MVPPDSGSLDGALDISLQSVCPDLRSATPTCPARPAVIAIVESVLGSTSRAASEPAAAGVR